MAKKTETASEKSKTKKAPGFFKKNLTEAQLQKKYLKYLEQPDDKKFIRSCYIPDGDTLSIRQDLSAKEAKRLKLLKKAIAQNRKFAVKLLPLGIAAALVAALVIFFTVFANPLLQRALETGLEAVFEARVNADNFRISLLKFEAGMSSLTIADRDRPMKNLIQFSTMRIKLRPQAVLRGKVYIEEIRADHIRFGTDRTVSGALPDRPPKETKPKQEVTIPPLVNLENFDPMALLNQEYEKLQTPKLYDSAAAAYETAAARWKGEESAARARLEEIRTRAEPLLKINVNDYRTLTPQTIEQITTVVSEVNALVTSVEAAKTDVERMVSGAREDINAALALEQSARNAISADFNHLRSYLDLGSGAALEVLEPVIGSILSGAAETYLSYGERALEILEKVKALQARLPKSAKPAAREKYRGRDVIFPTREYPRFFLGTLATDVLTPSDWQWDFELAGVSSDPDLSGLPTTLDLTLAEGGGQRRGAFKGRADFRSNAEERFNAEVSGGGFPVDISADLDKIGVGGFTGNADFTVNAKGRTDGGFSGQGAVTLAEAALRNPSNTFAQAAAEAIREVARVNLGIEYGHSAAGENSFALTTNFADILKNALTNIVGQYRAKAEAALEQALREKIAQYIDGKFVSKEELDTVFAAIRGDSGAIDELKNTLDKKKAELENKLRSAAEDAAKEVVDQAKAQGEEAVRDILRGEAPSAPTLPSIPNLPANPFRR